MAQWDLEPTRVAQAVLRAQQPQVMYVDEQPGFILREGDLRFVRFKFFLKFFKHGAPRDYKFSTKSRLVI